jgi:hypothetical protein
MTFCTAHFAVLSAGSAALGVTGAYIFLYFYLREFDWHLIWLVEYTDVIKFGLVIISFLGGFSLCLQAAGTWVSAWEERAPGRVPGLFKLIIFAAAIVVVVQLAYERSQEEPNYIKVALTALEFAIIGMLIVEYYRVVTNFNRFSWLRLVETVAITLFGAGIFAFQMAYSVREAPPNLVITKTSGVQVRNLSAIIFTPTYAMFWDGYEVRVFRTSEISEIASVAEGMIRPDVPPGEDNGDVDRPDPE